MKPADFDAQFNRLTAHFHLPVDASRETIAMDWLKALEHFHEDALEHGVTVLIKSAQDRFWPPLGKLLTLVQSRIDRYDRQPGKCATCAGSTWIESWPMKTRDGHVYEYLQRCPDCGIPAPEMKQSAFMVPLTKEEFERYRAGQWEHPAMPRGLEAKPGRDGEKTEMKAAMEALRVKLFGHLNVKDGAA
jgi:hypothetical protein